jgi:hypothetical protein
MFHCLIGKGPSRKKKVAVRTSVYINLYIYIYMHKYFHMRVYAGEYDIHKDKFNMTYHKDIYAMRLADAQQVGWSYCSIPLGCTPRQICGHSMAQHSAGSRALPGFLADIFRKT